MSIYPRIPKNTWIEANMIVILKNVILSTGVPSTVWNACSYRIRAIPKSVRNGMTIQIDGLFSRAQPLLRAHFIPMMNFTMKSRVATEKNAIENISAILAVALL